MHFACHTIRAAKVALWPFLPSAGPCAHPRSGNRRPDNGWPADDLRWVQLYSRVARQTEGGVAWSGRDCHGRREPPAHGYVEVWHQGQRVARHERCYGRHEKVLELEHYLDALVRKPGALAGSTALEQCRAQGRWPASYDRFWEVLRQRQGKAAGTRAMIDVLLLAREHGPERVRQAVEEALQFS